MKEARIITKCTRDCANTCGLVATVRDGRLTNIREYVDTQALARASQMDASGSA